MVTDSSGGKMSFAWFHSINVKGNWSHLAEKNSRPRPRAISPQYLSCHENV